MTRKGQITSIDSVKKVARVTFKDLDDITTAEIPYANNLTPQINDRVAVVFFSSNMLDGLIIAVF